MVKEDYEEILEGADDDWDEEDSDEEEDVEKDNGD